MMSYTSKYPDLFKAPLFIRESGYWQNRMLPYLEAEGWAVITVDCAGVTSIQDFAYRLVESIEVKNHPFFIGTQAHPELKSRPNNAHPLFRGFVDAILELKK